MSHVCDKCGKEYKSSGWLTKHKNGNECAKTSKGGKGSEIKSDKSDKGDRATRQIVFNNAFGSEARKGLCYCCKKATIDALNSDWHEGHIVSRKCGGSNDPENKRPVCATCNLAMRDNHMYDYMVAQGFSIPEDLELQMSKEEVKKNMVVLQKIYETLINKFDFSNTSHVPFITGVLCSVIDIASISDPDGHHATMLGFIFNVNTMSEKSGMFSINNYKESLLNLPRHHESFKRIVLAIDLCIHGDGGRCYLNGHDVRLQCCQIRYWYYLILTSRMTTKHEDLVDKFKRTNPYTKFIKSHEELSTVNITALVAYKPEFRFADLSTSLKTLFVQQTWSTDQVYEYLYKLLSPFVPF
jgi:hypothetical protein